MVGTKSREKFSWARIELFGCHRYGLVELILRLGLQHGGEVQLEAGVWSVMGFVVKNPFFSWAKCLHRDNALCGNDAAPLPWGWQSVPDEEQ